ncbi:auxin-responsive protein SAUR32-like [Coffea eugenioides]|uniref:auxin-responsive protein SAUR32-like n=1 Tax=Coffea eugenioides TaxID=49369 RepID=UPI000F60C896|nr:auxin-responsive protein SAUR32-like [Coffea eugenioides]
MEEFSGGSSAVVPKGYLAVYVGEGLKRFVIPMEDLGHQAFGILLTEAEEEFEFQQGVLKIPCQVAVFEKILKMMNKRRDAPNAFHLHDFRLKTLKVSYIVRNHVTLPFIDDQHATSHRFLGFAKALNDVLDGMAKKGLPIPPACQN